MRLLEKKIYWNLKATAPDRTLWRNRFEIGYGRVARQTTK